MYGIDILMEEHKNILAFTEYLRSVCFGILKGESVDTGLLRECIDFIRTYADKNHHGKEEKILFRIMLEDLGSVADKLVRNGMLVEHDQGRLYVSELETALDEYDKDHQEEHKLDIIANAIGYCELLKRHAGKEDAVVYTFALRSLSKERLEQADKESEAFVKQAGEDGIIDKYEGWLREKIK